MVRIPLAGFLTPYDRQAAKAAQAHAYMSKNESRTLDTQMEDQN